MIPTFLGDADPAVHTALLAGGLYWDGEHAAARNLLRTVVFPTGATDRALERMADLIDEWRLADDDPRHHFDLHGEVRGGGSWDEYRVEQLERIDVELRGEARRLAGRALAVAS